MIIIVIVISIIIVTIIKNLANCKSLSKDIWRIAPFVATYFSLSVINMTIITITITIILLMNFMI